MLTTTRKRPLGRGHSGRRLLQLQQAMVRVLALLYFHSVLCASFNQRSPCSLRKHAIYITNAGAATSMCCLFGARVYAGDSLSAGADLASSKGSSNGHAPINSSSEQQLAALAGGSSSSRGSASPHHKRPGSLSRKSLTAEDGASGSDSDSGAGGLRGHKLILSSYQLAAKVEQLLLNVSSNLSCMDLAALFSCSLRVLFLVLASDTNSVPAHQAKRHDAGCSSDGVHCYACSVTAAAYGALWRPHHNY
jgi:hypothetical protein